MRAYLVALGLTALILGVPLFFAGYVHVGCSVSGPSSNPVFTDCSGASNLELGGVILIVAAVVLFAASVVPDERTRSK